MLLDGCVERPLLSKRVSQFDSRGDRLRIEVDGRSESVGCRVELVEIQQRQPKLGVCVRAGYGLRDVAALRDDRFESLDLGIRQPCERHDEKRPKQSMTEPAVQPAGRCVSAPAQPEALAGRSFSNLPNEC